MISPAITLAHTGSLAQASTSLSSSLAINEVKKEFNNNLPNLPFLKTDTDNIIKYSIKNPDENKIKKRYFWNLLKDE